MTAHRIALLALAVLAAGTSLRAQPAAPPLPDGAKVRIAPTGLAFRSNARVTLLPDGKTVLVPKDGGGVRRFDAITGKALDTGDAPAAAGLIPVIVSGDGKRAIVPNATHSVVRDVGTGEVVRELKSEPSLGLSTSSDAVIASFSHDGKVVARGGSGRGGKGDVVVWDVEKGDILFRPELAFPGAAVPVLSADGKLLATRPLQGTFGQSRSVQVWDIAAKKELFEAKITTGMTLGISAVVFSPDGTLLAGSCGDGVIDVFDVKTGKAKFALLGRSRQGYRLAFSPDGKVLAALAYDGAVQRWSVADEKHLGTTEGPAALPVGGAQGLVFGTNDRAFAWGMIGPCPVVWEAFGGKLLTPVPELTSVVYSMGFRAGGTELVAASVEGRVTRWDVATGKPLGEIALRPSRATSSSASRTVLNISRDGAWGLALGNPSAVYDLATGLEEFIVPLPQAFSGASHTLPSTDNTKAVRVSYPSDRKKPTLCTVWDLVKHRKLGEVELTSDTPLFPVVSVSPDGTRLVTAAAKGDAADRTLIVSAWDVKTGKMLTEAKDINSQLPSHIVAVSNVTAIVASGNGRLRAFDYEIGRGGDVIEPGDARGGSSFSVAVSADHKRFAHGVQTKDPDGFGVRVYDWPSGKPLHTFRGHQSAVRALAFSPDGKTLASSADDTTIMLWDLTTIGAK
ncbi:MAG: WD40 repeat domain-containing protein [Planctomycetes bacterium]|nr:WD40 repeat domain-containing protein [Planctomycetota bacterium]